ncbi:hypothetical protein FA95DRAFT_1552197 [Auriscalpium vulgare]|uniref:Uncharacterized protein n=1 Tax=Auriscalpium vulgare TaxID=40419 RepID=A0ACB8SB79_9AGAM|nr:hypothetical protein FA95DRAFT_1552197 [Auriscalpium vulgare]
MPQVHTLNLTSDFINGDVIPEELLTSPAPRMHALTLRQDYRGALLPSAFLGNEAPLLRHLSLTGFYPICWTSVFDNLLSLEIITDPPVFVLSNFNAMFDAISRMPALQDLTLSHCLPTLAASPAQHSVPLVHLKSCTLDGPFLDAVHFLARLQLPSEVMLRLQLIMDDSDGLAQDIHQSDLSTLLLYFNGPVDFPLCKLSITNGNTVLKINGERIGGGLYAEFAVAFLWTTPEEPPQLAVLNALAKSIAFESVESLSVDVVSHIFHSNDITPVDTDMWCTILRRGADMTDIHASGEAGGTLIRALSSLDNTEPGQWVPLLENLEFHCMPFYSFRSGDDIEYDTAAILRTWLGLRCNTGRPLASITLLYCEGVPSGLLELSPSTKMYQREIDFYAPNL